MSTPNYTESLIDALAVAVAAGTFVKLTLDKPRGKSDLNAIDIRPIRVKRMLMLSFTYHHRTNDIVKNHPASEAMGMVADALRDKFTRARMQTTEADFLLNAEGLERRAATITIAPDLNHDRTKKRMLAAEGKPYLHALEITDAKGNVIPRSQDKFRQINKYVEILDGLLKDLLPGKNLSVIDMGAGKGYLTFALYDHLRNHLGREVEVTGVEYRAELVKQCNEIAGASGFSDLRFAQGSIADYDCKGADVVIALHACDTATDDALAKAIRAQASLIVAAPCCHKQLRKSMGKLAAAHTLTPALRFGTYEERMAEMLTDTIRVQLLERAGYKCKLFEFITDAHTPKNVMIVAERGRAPVGEDKKRINDAIMKLKAEFNIREHALEALLS